MQDPAFPHFSGRPRSLSVDDLQQARALLADPEITVEQVVKRLRVGVVVGAG